MTYLDDKIAEFERRFPKVLTEEEFSAIKTGNYHARHLECSRGIDGIHQEPTRELVDDWFSEAQKMLSSIEAKDGPLYWRVRPYDYQGDRFYGLRGRMCVIDTEDLV